MGPGIDKLLRVKLADRAGNFSQLQKPGTRWNQQTNRELNGRHGGDQIAFRDSLQQIQIRVTRGPGRERHKSWLQRQA